MEAEAAGAAANPIKFQSACVSQLFNLLMFVCLAQTAKP